MLGNTILKLTLGSSIAFGLYNYGYRRLNAEEEQPQAALIGQEASSRNEELRQSDKTAQQASGIEQEMQQATEEGDLAQNNARTANSENSVSRVVVKSDKRSIDYRAFPDPSSYQAQRYLSQNSNNEPQIQRESVTSMVNDELAAPQQSQVQGALNNSAAELQEGIRLGGRSSIKNAIHPEAAAAGAASESGLESSSFAAPIIALGLGVICAYGGISLWNQWNNNRR